MTAASLPVRRPGVRVHRGRDSVEVVAADGAVLGTANDIAVAVLELCDGSTSLTEMVDAVCAVFAVDEATAEADLALALDRLAELGAVDHHVA